jgi:hypothetical protein
MQAQWISCTTNFMLKNIPEIQTNRLKSEGFIVGNSHYPNQFKDILNKEQSIQTNDPTPNTLTMTKSLANSTTKWIVSGFKRTDEETLKNRTEVCQSCEFWNAQAFNNTGRCMKCGCSTWVKLRMATEKCPIGKW